MKYPCGFESRLTHHKVIRSLSVRNLTARYPAFNRNDAGSSPVGRTIFILGMWVIMNGWVPRDIIPPEIHTFRVATLEAAGGREKVRNDILPTIKQMYSYYGALRIFGFKYEVRFAFTCYEWVRMYQGYFPDEPETQIKRGSIPV